MGLIEKKYKQTELGIIPNDWQIKEFQDVMTGFFSGATPYRGHPEYYKGVIKWITSGELKYNIITDTIEKITEQAVKNTNLKILPKGTFLFAITGLEAEGTRGSCGVTGEEATTNQSCMALFPKETLDSNYLYHFYVWQGKMLALKYCQGTKQQSYTAKIARSLPIIIPPTKSEQTAIATALSDVDALIENLEELIVKKRNIKQGVMQELLNPKDCWSKDRLGNLCKKITTGKVDANAMKKEGIYRFYTCAKNYFFIDKYAFDDEALLISGNGENVGYIHYFKGKFNAYQRTYVITGFFINVHFLKSYLDKYLPLRIEVEVNAGNTPYIKMSTLADMVVYYPSSTKEQESIAQKLSDMDFLIANLEQKLDKYKMIKNGMMQSLLTGKIRLI